MNMDGAVRGAPWSAFEFDCRPQQLSRVKRYFTNVSPQGDPALHFPGQLFVSSSGNEDESEVVGQLYVEYDVLLSVPANVASETAKKSILFQWDNLNQTTTGGGQLLTSNLTPTAESTSQTTFSEQSLAPLAERAWQVIAGGGLRPRQSGTFLASLFTELGNFMSSHYASQCQSYNPNLAATHMYPGVANSNGNSTALTIHDPDSTGAITLTRKTPAGNNAKRNLTLCTMGPSSTCTEEDVYSIVVDMAKTLGKQVPWLTAAMDWKKNLFVDANDYNASNTLAYSGVATTNATATTQTSSAGGDFGVANFTALINPLHAII
jgi:hypothetical protein